MGAEPKKLFNYRIAPEIKWTSYMAEPILKNNLNNFKNNPQYLKLIENICNGFEIIRKHSNLFESNIYSLMLNCRIKNLNIKSFELFKERLLIDMNDQNDRKNFLTDKININFDTWGGWIIDKYHESEFIHNYLL
jgi:hypothetical protein